MDRRRFLAGLCTCVGGIAGCGAPSAPRSTGGGRRTGGATPAGASADEDERRGDDTPQSRGSEAVEERTPRVCEESVREKFGIRAIDDPATASDWASAGLSGSVADGLPPGSTVIGLTADGRARAYPLRVLFRHEIVNDHFCGPVLVTFCPLCNSGMVARRTVEGEPTTFAVSGLLWAPEEGSSVASEDEERVFGVTRLDPDAEVVRSRNLVMYDRATSSYWSQLLARAICGPMAGTRLSLLPAQTTTWEAWRDAHPETDVLLPAPHSGTV